MNFFKINFSLLIFALFLFTGTAEAQLNVLSDGTVGIGTTSSSNAQLRAYNNSETYGVRSDNYLTGSGSSYGFRSYISNGSTGYKLGLLINTYQNGSSSSYTRGIYSYISPAGTGNAYGIASIVGSGGTGTKYGVYASSSTGYAGYFVGDLHVTGAISLLPPVNNPTSKAAVLANTTEKVNSLTAMAVQSTDRNAAPRTKYTLDVASLKQAFPELVYEVEQPGEFDENGEALEQGKKVVTVNAIDYNGLIPVLVQAIKELQDEVDALKSK